jgi:tetratricopeptide (TPR) repeat protein
MRGAAVAVIVGFLIVGCAERRSEQYRRQGDSYFGLRKYPEAGEAYRNATLANPANALAKLGLGRCLAATGKLEEALACFQEAVTLAPQDDAGYLETVNLLMKLGNPDEAFAAAQRYETVNPECGGVLRASLLLRSGRNADALALLLQLRDRFPDSSLVRTHLACAELASGEPQKAETELQTVLEKQEPESIGARMLMVEVRNAQGKIGEMIDQLEKLKTESPDHALVLAHALIQAKRAEEGESLVRDTLGRTPGSGWAHFVLGSYMLDRGQRDDAAASLQAAAIALPREAVIMRDLAAAQAPAGTPPSPFRSAAAPLGKEGPARGAASTEDWQSLWRQAALRRLLDERQRFIEKGGANLMETLVLASLFCGNGPLAEELAKGLPADSPLNAYLQALRERDPQKIVEALRPWNSQAGDLRLLAQNALGFAMGLTGARGQAVQVLSGCRESYPDNGVSLFNLAQVFRAANMPRFAARTLQKLTATFPENVEAHRMLFDLFRAAGARQEARQTAEIMYALFPESREATLAICEIYVDCKELQLAKGIAERYLQSHADDPEMQLALASTLLREGQADEALKVLGKMPLSGDIAPRVTALTALSYAVSQDWQKVVDLAGPSDPHFMMLPTRFILAAAYLKTGQKEKAMAVLTQEGKDEPFGGHAGAVLLQALGRSSPALAENEIALSKALSAATDTLVDFASGAAYQVAYLHDAAYQAFKRVDAALPGDNDYLLDFMFGSLPYVVRLKEVAQEARTLAEKHAARPRAWLGYAVVLQSLEDADGERGALDKAAEAGPNDPEVFLRRGNFFARRKDMNTAITEYRRLLQLRPDDPVGNNNLAYYLILTGGDITQALRSAQVAQKGLPDDPRVVHTLGVAQLRAGDLEHSKTNLTAALQLMPGDPSLLLDYGRLQIALGNAEEGRRDIETALRYSKELGLDFDRKAEAEDILAKTPVPNPAPKPAPESSTSAST